MILIIVSQSTPAQTISSKDIIDDLIYADLVVEGEIVGMSDILVPHGDYFMSMPNGPDLPFKNIKFKVSRALIGEWEDDYVPLMALVSYGDSYNYDLEVGDKYIIALKLHPGGKGVFSAKQYILRNDSARFLLVGDKFLRGSKRKPVQEGKISDLTSSIGQIKESRSVSTLTHAAEIIIRGVVTGVSKEIEDSSCGEKIEYQDITVSITSLIKGDIKKDTVKVRMILRGRYFPEWRVKVPEVNDGEEWYLFLKWHQELGYYPFAGVNGMFRIEGNRIIRDNHNTDYLTLDKNSFEKNIIDEVEIWKGP
jgi:hypothetical protein